MNDGNVRAFIDDYLVLQIDCTHERIPASPQASCMWSSLSLSSLSSVIQLSQTLIEKPPLDDHVPFLNSQHGKPSHLRSTASHAPKLPNNVAKGASIR